jgi:hypothetical protein
MSHMPVTPPSRSWVASYCDYDAPSPQGSWQPTGLMRPVQKLTRAATRTAPLPQVGSETKAAGLVGAHR